MIFKTLITSFFINLFLTLIKFIYSIIFSSSTLLADAVHCLSDMLTDIVSILGSKLSTKKPDKNHPFGHGKIEYVTSMILSVFIIIMGFGIISSSVSRGKTNPSIFPMIIILITFFCKLFLSKYLFIKGKKYKSNILLSNAEESKYDSFASLIALFFTLISYLGKYNSLLLYADLIGSIVISLLTIRVGIKLFIINVNSVIGEIETDEEIVLNLKKLIINEKIYKIRRFTLIKYGHYYQVEVDIKLDENFKLKELYKIEENIKRKLKQKDYIKYVTVNMGPL